MPQGGVSVAFDNHMGTKAPEPPESGMCPRPSVAVAPDTAWRPARPGASLARWADESSFVLRCHAALGPQWPAIFYMNFPPAGD